VFNKALAKTPGERYGSCVEFADALAQHLQTAADEAGATVATAAALPVAKPRNEPGSLRGLGVQWKIVIPLLAVLIVVGVVLVVVSVT